MTKWMKPFIIYKYIFWDLVPQKTSLENTKLQCKFFYHGHENIKGIVSRDFRILFYFTA
jgi:hypothetical protein